MESPKGKLCAGFADALRRHDAYRFADVHGLTRSQIASVALGARALFRVTGEHRTDFNFLNARLFDTLGHNLVDERIAGANQIVGDGIDDVFLRHPAHESRRKRLHELVALPQVLYFNAFYGPAILYGGYDILHDVDKPPGKVSGVGGLQRSIGQSFTGAMR